ncbi:hypothetical protein BKA83DRAFT_4119949 [Pisolithus microcarpus]|nr:hypothetical protein BKA83DRAFT_4119949 [Pisolithus microcarpus]
MKNKFSYHVSYTTGAQNALDTATILMKMHSDILMSTVTPSLKNLNFTSYGIHMELLVILWIAAIAPFTGLWCFPRGWHFKQWTGDDSRGLMKLLYGSLSHGFTSQPLKGMYQKM